MGRTALPRLRHQALMPPDPRVHVGVAGVAFDDQDRLAMLRRAGKEGVAAHGFGQWSVPGGWIDFGEIPEQTVVREMLEEVGLTCINPDYLGYVTNTHPDQDLHVVCLFFRVEVQHGVLHNMEPDKCSAVEWVHVTKIHERELFAPLDSFAREYGYKEWVNG